MRSIIGLNYFVTLRSLDNMSIIDCSSISLNTQFHNRHLVHPRLVNLILHIENKSSQDTYTVLILLLGTPPYHLSTTSMLRTRPQAITVQYVQSTVPYRPHKTPHLFIYNSNERAQPQTRHHDDAAAGMEGH